MSAREAAACARVAWAAYVEHVEATRRMGVFSLQTVGLAERQGRLLQLVAATLGGGSHEDVSRELERVVCPGARGQGDHAFESRSALDQARVRLVASVIRATAASLGMVVRYPDGTEIDWSRAVDMGRAPMAVTL